MTLVLGSHRRSPARWVLFAAERGDVFGLRRWYTPDLPMGLFFVLGQGYEYFHLVTHGTTIASSAYGSVFYLATGYGLPHVVGGLIAFVLLLLRTPDEQVHPRPGDRLDRRVLPLALRRHRLIALFATIYHFIR